MTERAARRVIRKILGIAARNYPDQRELLKRLENQLLVGISELRTPLSKSLPESDDLFDVEVVGDLCAGRIDFLRLTRGKECYTLRLKGRHVSVSRVLLATLLMDRQLWNKKLPVSEIRESLVRHPAYSKKGENSMKVLAINVVPLIRVIPHNGVIVSTSPNWYQVLVKSVNVVPSLDP